MKAATLFSRPLGCPHGQSLGIPTRFLLTFVVPYPFRVWYTQ